MSLGWPMSTPPVTLAGMGRRTAQRADEQRGAPAAWRLTTQTAVSGFAWDVRLLRFYNAGHETSGVLSASGDAGDDFGVQNTTNDDARVWGGRPDGAHRFHITLTAASGDLPIDRIVLDQPGPHWARSVVLERRGDDGEWHTVRHFGDLQRGHNDLFLDGRQNPSVEAPSAPQANRPRSAAPAPTFEFGTFDDRRILVTIAAYRDPELPNTIADAIAQAAYPEHLRFAICHQFDDETIGLLDRWTDDPRFSIDAVHHSESRGCGWARNRTFAMFDDERYLLQIDAHTRFAARWDVRFIDMLESTGSELPILTTYPSRYTLDDDGEVVYDLEAGIQQLYVDEVRPDLTTLQRTRLPTDLTRPGPSPTLAAGLIFTRGRFCRDVDYDPEIYFGGEEISLAARAFTSGYDLLYPTETLIWHLYDHDHPKHWEDHSTHSASHADAVTRLRTLFQGDASTLGKYGLGLVRSLVEFERFADIDLGAVPTGADGALTITIDRSVIEPRDDYAAFVVVLLDDSGNEVQRHDVVTPNVLDLSCQTVRLHDTPKAARHYAVLPVTRSGRIGEIAIRSIRAGKAAVPAGRAGRR
jgi:glycosyltransferase involved in cell wall biosynthesis